MQHAAAQAYAQTAQKTASPRDLEAGLLLKAALKLQSVSERDDATAQDWHEALTYNRRLWTILSTSATEAENPLPVEVKQNLANLALFVFKQTMSAETARDPAFTRSLISINRSIAAGLRGQG